MFAVKMTNRFGDSWLVRSVTRTGLILVATDFPNLAKKFATWDEAEQLVNNPPAKFAKDLQLCGGRLTSLRLPS
jgi:hypothetical protein